MEYTKQQREAMADAFRAAKKVLWKGTGYKPSNKERYICSAIIMAPGRGGCTPARSVVSQRLGKHAYLGKWLTEQGVPREQQTDRLMQQHRHAWLDLLIKEFSA
jgi:hypothetical protein